MSRWSLRARLMALGLLGVAVLQAAASAVLYVGLSVAGLNAIDASARATAAQVSGLAEAGRLPDTLPVTGSGIVQVLDAQGRVVSASGNADRLTALLRPRELARAREEPVTVPGSRLGIASRLRVRVVPVDAGPQAGSSVVVAEPVDDLTRSEDSLRTLLLVTFPLLLLVLGLVAWRMIGAALRPVEELRVAAERVSDSTRSERLPVPATRDEVHALATTLNSMLDRIGAARDRERDLVADVAHELRNPLASMRLQVDVARRLGEGGELVDDLDHEVARMSALVDDLLVLARLDAGRAAQGAEGGTVPVAVRPVLQALAASYDAARTDGDGPAVRVLPGPDAVALTRPDELDRVLANLVANARRHARAEVTLAVETSAGTGAGRRVLVRVDDDGPGVPEADRERVFERFTRLDEARDRDAGGSGLGLAIVRELVRSRGGEVRLATAPAGGLRAEVDLAAAPTNLVG